MEYSIEDIIEGCKANKAKYQEALYTLFASKIMGICYRYAKTTTEAEDILQETFVKVFKNIDKLEKAGSIGAWIKRTAVNTAINNYHKNKKHYGQLNSEYVTQANSSYEDIISKLSNAELLEVIDKLPDGYRMVFSLYVIEGYSHREIAENLKISEGTSKSQLSRAKSFLKNQLEKLNIKSYERQI